MASTIRLSCNPIGRCPRSVGELSYDAVVLAGGRSRRMGVADKTRLIVGGTPLLDRALRAVAGADRVVVVGESRVTTTDVTWVREEPPGGGPAAAIAAGLAHVTADVVVLLAGDMPLISTSDVDRLVDAVSDDGAVYIDDAGQEQWLCSAWRTTALRNTPFAAGTSLREALCDFEFTRLPAPAVVVDCDTPEDLVRAEELLP